MNLVVIHGDLRLIHSPMILLNQYLLVDLLNDVVQAYLQIFRLFWARQVMMVHFISLNNQSMYQLLIEEFHYTNNILIQIRLLIDACKIDTVFTGKHLLINMLKQIMFYHKGKIYVDDCCNIHYLIYVFSLILTNMKDIRKSTQMTSGEIVQI